MIVLNSLSVKRLTNAAHFEFMTRFYGVVNDYETSNEMFQSAKTDLLNAIRKEDELMVLFRSSIWTPVMATKRKNRDNSYRAIVDCIRSWSRLDYVEYYEDAMALKRYINLYKIDPRTAPTDDLTGDYRNLISDLTQPENLQKVKNIGAERFLNELILTNTEFCRALVDRAKEKTLVEGTVKEARAATDIAFKEMVVSINSHYHNVKDEKLAEIIKLCNVLFKTTKMQMLNRKKKTEEEATTPDNSAGQPTETPSTEIPSGESPSGETTNAESPANQPETDTEINVA